MFPRNESEGLEKSKNKMGKANPRCRRIWFLWWKTAVLFTSPGAVENYYIEFKLELSPLRHKNREYLSTGC